MENKLAWTFIAILAILACWGVIKLLNVEEYYEDEIQYPDMECVAFSQESRASMILNHTINAPEELNCSMLAWVIENSAYPKEISWHYRRKVPACGQDNISIVSSRMDQNVKEIYDDYFFRKCLTKHDAYRDK